MASDSPPRWPHVPIENISQWLDDGGNANGIGQDGRPLLHQAVRYHRPDVIRLVIGCGADTELEFKRQTPLMVAAEHGFADCVAALLEGGADVDYCRSLPTESDMDTQDDDSIDPSPLAFVQYPVLPNALACAVVHGTSRCVELLLEAGANPNGYLCRAGGHPDPLTKAIECLNLEAVAALLKAGADVASSLSMAQFIVGPTTADVRIAAAEELSTYFLHVIAAGSFAKYDASRRAPFVAMLERVGAFPIPNEMIAIVCAFWLRAGEYYGDVEDDEDAWAADLEEELFA